MSRLRAVPIFPFEFFEPRKKHRERRGSIVRDVFSAERRTQEEK